MRRLPGPLIVSLCLVVAGWHVSADDRVFFMPLPPEVLPVTVGANAFQIVGTYYSGGAMSWMPTSGDQRLGGTSARGISLDGKSILGSAPDSQGILNAAIWTGGQSWRLLGGFAPDSRPCDTLLSDTYGASGDGKVLVGLAYDGCTFARAFRWEQSTGMVDLGSTTANSTRANGVSADGRVVVGWQESPTGVRLAAKWVDFKQELIQRPDSLTGEAFAANRDGSIIVGQVCNANDPIVTAAWMWTAAKGVQCFPVTRPATLPPRFYLARMQALSDDGRVVGGAFTAGLDSEALIWLDGQLYFLQDYLAQNGYPDAFRGWENTGFLTSVSPDGRTLVGYGAGPTTFQGYMVVLPGRGTK